ncbi:type IV pili methyl-accepting chemotaxis transducer N-terminal domain-containing protein [Flavobacterium sp. GNP002]
MQYKLYSQRSDSRIINISGKQRMLSQKLPKEILILNFVTDTSKSKQEIIRINEIISLWKFNYNPFDKEREYKRSIATFGSIETILSLNQYNVKVELQ